MDPRGAATEIAANVDFEAIGFTFGEWVNAQTFTVEHESGARFMVGVCAIPGSPES